LGTLRSRWAVHFSGNCVPAFKKVRELSSRAFSLKLSPASFVFVCSLFSDARLEQLIFSGYFLN